MNTIDRYILRTSLGAFAAVVLSLTAFIWVTQALREIDLITSQGQTVLVFIGMTGLLVPVLVLIISPVALLVAVLYLLNKLNGDSEMVVLNAAGMSPWRLFRPFLLVAVLVSILVAAISIYVAPKGLRELRTWAAKIRADLITTLVQPGRFTLVEGAVTVHIRERGPDGRLGGVFIDDRRNPKERTTFLAEHGEIVESAQGTFLVLASGSVQRHEATQRDPNLIMFDRYAFDLSQFNQRSSRSITFRERYLWELMFPEAKDVSAPSQAGRLRAELHDRIVGIAYPLAFVVIAYAFLGLPSTTRQSRAVALGMTILAVVALRLLGFGCVILSAQSVAALYVIYGAIILTILLGSVVIWRGTRVEPPSGLIHRFETILDRMIRRKATA